LTVEVCPGCGLTAETVSTQTHAYIAASPSCWAVYGEVLAREYSNPELASRAHQLTVDAYAAQHPGPGHPDKSVDVHLVGLHLMLDRGAVHERMPYLRKYLVDTAREWPQFPPPSDLGELRVDSVASAIEPAFHIEAARAWSESVWRAWSERHAAVIDLAERCGVTMQPGATG
jgi:hypothetical protein